MQSGHPLWPGPTRRHVPPHRYSATSLECPVTTISSSAPLLPESARRGPAAAAGSLRTDTYADGARTIEYVPEHRNEGQSRSYYWLLMLPAIIVLAAITIYPFFWLIWMSLHNVGATGGDEFVGLKNFERAVLSDDKYWNGWFLLLRYSAMCMTAEVLIGVLLAILLNGSRFEKVLVTIILMPMMMAPVIAGLVWYFLYNSTFGWYHWLFQSLGILGDTSILGSADTAMYGIVIVDVWQWTPLITLITLAGMKRVPRDQLEANMVDGAGDIRNFLSVTLPNLYPFLLIAILLRFMDNFRFIDVILTLTGGGPADATNILPVYLCRHCPHASPRDNRARQASGPGFRPTGRQARRHSDGVRGHGVQRHRHLQ
jgi:multiple sugar transport system permease protein